MKYNTTFMVYDLNERLIMCNLCTCERVEVEEFKDGKILLTCLNPKCRNKDYYEENIHLVKDN